MFLKKLSLKNWKNFQKCDLPFGARMFIVGPNASGKSNLLDALKFLRDICKEGGGLQTACQDRGGLSKIRCLSARNESQVEITAEFSNTLGASEADWQYSISIKQHSRGHRQAYLEHEKVWHKGKQLINRPDEDDRQDRDRLTQTSLEQITANKNCREMVRYLSLVQYLHVVPQLVRYSKLYTGPGAKGDPFGRNFLDRIATSQERTRKSRLKKIETALKQVVPQLKEFAFTKDERGFPHLETIYKHWRPKGAKQREDQLSDGTLRLIGFLWSLLESDSLLLLEEPELSLHSEIVKQLSETVFKILKNKKQVMVTTHSVDLLSHKGIGANEVTVLTPHREGTKVALAKDVEKIRKLMESGLPASEAVIPSTSARDIGQMTFAFGK